MATPTAHVWSWLDFLKFPQLSTPLLHTDQWNDFDYGYTHTHTLQIRSDWDGIVHTYIDYTRTLFHNVGSTIYYLSIGGHWMVRVATEKRNDRIFIRREEER